MTVPKPRLRCPSCEVLSYVWIRTENKYECYRCGFKEEKEEEPK